MSQAKVEIVRRAHQALNRGDMDALLVLCDVELRLDMSHRVFNPAVYTGHDGIWRFYSQVRDVWATYVWEPEELIEAGVPPGTLHFGQGGSVSRMPVDVQSEIEIARPRDEVAAFASDPDNAMAWYQNVKAVEWKTPRPVAVSSRIAFVAEFLGRRLSYTCEVIVLVPGERFVMRTAEEPFPMETTYTWADASGGATRMTLRNRGEPAGFAKVTAPLMAAAMGRANRKDLRRLKEILERAR